MRSFNFGNFENAYEICYFNQENDREISVLVFTFKELSEIANIYEQGENIIHSIKSVGHKTIELSKFREFHIDNDIEIYEKRFFQHD